MSLRNTLAWSAILVFGASIAACSKSSEKVATAPSDGQVAIAGHAHEGWWCNEHGVPEEVCAQCSTKLAMNFKAKGDWCKEHDRPDSQCFACHPEKEGKFATQYEAKYGKKPPKPHDSEGHEHHGARSG